MPSRTRRATSLTRSRRQILATASGAVVACLIAPPPRLTRAEEAVVARIEAMDGAAAIVRGELRIDAVPGLPLTLFDIVITHAASRLELRFVDGSTVILGPEARLSLDAFRIDGGGMRENGLLTIMNGAVRALVAPGTADTFSIQGQSAIASVRGTEYAVIEEETRTSVLVLDGMVAVAGVDRDWTVALGPGDGVDVPHDGDLREIGDAPPPVNAWGQARIDSVLALTRRPVG